MITGLRDRSRQYNLFAGLVIVTVLALAFLLGQRASPLWLGLLGAGLGGLVLLTQPTIGILVLVTAALVVPMEIGTGTEVRLNTATVIVPALTAVWLLDMARRRHISFVSSRTNLPLLLFLAANLVSLLVGRVIWNPHVPVGDNFILVQLAQWAIFVFSALAFWLTANLVTHEKTLWRLTALFLLVAGGVAILRSVPGVGGFLDRFTTIAFIRAPLWVLLTALVGGQLLWNSRLTLVWRIFLGSVLLAVVAYAFVDQQEAASNWVGIGAVAGVLVWLRFPRLRWPLATLILLMGLAGLLLPTIYNFAGGDDEWINSGGSRLALIERVVDVTLRNPITGLGPAAYRPYANATPLVYLHIFWANPLVSAHNNYVDLFAHGGILGLLFFGWFAVEVARLGYRLRQRYRTGFAAAYINGVLAAGAGALVIMVLADWILPFIYNIGFPGFQASVLVWLFMGGLVALENMPGETGDCR